MESVPDYRLGVLNTLSKSKGAVTEREIAARQGLTQAAVGKAVHWLRNLGYEIAGDRVEGYRLISRADDLYSWELARGLKTLRWGRKVYYYPEIDSTNALAWELASAGELEGTVVLADSQDRGRGRQGREWISPRGVNIYATLILRPLISPGEGAQISLLAALAAARALERGFNLRPELKWPNDVLLEGKKVAGILSEAKTEGGRVSFVICGVGINVNLDPGELPDEVGINATSLAVFSSGPVARVKVLQNFLEEFEGVYRDYLNHGFNQFIKEWGRRSILEGKWVRAVGENKELEGRVTGIDRSGALELENEKGRISRVVAGEVTISSGGKETKCSWS